MEKRPEETISDIHRLMERSSRFHALSGFSLVSAGICGLLGSWWIATAIMSAPPPDFYGQKISQSLVDEVILAATCTLLAAVLSGFLFTWFKTRKKNLPLWDAIFRKVSVNFAIPMIAGGALVTGMFFYHQYRFIAPACLLFYGLALVNAGHFTLRDIRFLGMFELLIGIICLFGGYEIVFLSLGFGVMNILYGLVIWYKYR